MADFLDDKRREIAARLNELRPLVDEYESLEAATAALASVPAAPAPITPPRRTRRTATASSSRRPSATGKPRGRPKGSATRPTEALQIVKAHPGITIPEIAEKMGIKPNYLYRVLHELTQSGLVAKHGRGWKATQTP